MAKNEKPDAADESKAPDGMLAMGDHMVLRPGQLVQVKGVDPVMFDGDINAFVNELSALIHPMRVGVSTREVERDAVIDGISVTVKAPEYTIRLLDG